ncbi:MAG: chromate efflux transporter [Candidatus Devosia phytovorans]|uniref:Chromate efflux transporter n=1 Tax=Candidatus Devosia phytovorans TaxID=3121372 RepID=A0AAJ5VSY9_9HYPH|nr:chromate efflux transporter [Devosia sp.]WEK02809.1 MAG: chromate efflux transporter [Devosia sp.]
MAEDSQQRNGSASEVFLALLKLGLTSFGGPIAHLGYFRDEIVLRRNWLGEKAYADLVALCQFLPGPASSQVGFALGLWRAGPLGALAAWAGFTLPSALLLVLFALGAGALDHPVAQGVLHGLKLVAVAVVAQAVWGMAKSLTPDRQRAGIALAAVAATVILAGSSGQVVAIVLGGVAGLLLCRGGAVAVENTIRFGITPFVGLLCLALFVVLLLGLPLLAGLGHGAALFDAFYRAGSLVFGGGHVVLPLLEAETVARGWVSQSDFLAGYGATQAVPGPLFTFAAYLGTASDGVFGAIIALIAIFLPGLLLLVGVLPFWDALRGRPLAQAAMRGANAAVVGILGAALYDPVWISAVLSPRDFLLALTGFLALVVWKIAPWLVVLALAAIGGLLAL